MHKKKKATKFVQLIAYHASQCPAAPRPAVPSPAKPSREAEL